MNDDVEAVKVEAASLTPELVDDAELDHQMIRCADFLRQGGAPEIAERLLAAWRDDRAAGQALKVLRGVPRTQGSGPLDALVTRLEATRAAVDRAVAEAVAWFADGGVSAAAAADVEMRQLFSDLAEHWRQLGNE